MDKRNNDRNIKKINDDNFLDEKRAEYLRIAIERCSTWDFCQRAISEAVNIYSEIIGTKGSSEHEKIITYLLGNKKL